MRLLELLLIVSSSLGLIYTLVRIHPPRLSVILSSCSIVLTFLHLLVEGYRWQLVPAYLSIVTLLVVLLWRYKRAKTLIENSRWISGLRKIIASVIIILVLTGTSFVLPTLLPAFDISPPSGPYQIGTDYLEFTDQNRVETFVNDETYRKVFTQVWYPTEVLKSNFHPYLEEPEESLKIITDLFQLPSGFFNHLKHIGVNSILKAPISNQKSRYPVLIYQHGYSFWMSQNTVLMEHLASHGFIVVSIAHPYETNYAYTNEDKLIAFPFNNEMLQKRWNEILAKVEVSKLIGLIIDTESVKKSEKYERRMLNLTPYMQESVRLWADDGSFLLNELDRLNSEGSHFLSGKLDMEKIGAFGMSFGGAATAQLMIRDERIKAGINMDGGIQGDLLQNSLSRPFMFMISGNHGFLNNVHFQRCEKEAYMLSIKGSKHLDFCDLNLISPVLFEQFGLMGTIEKERMNEIINEYAYAFFKQYLVEPRGNWLPSFEEVTIKKRNIN